MRKYQPIWEALKVKGLVSIAAPASFHPRIKKAVIKEKGLDSTHKACLKLSGKRATLDIITFQDSMTFRLVTSIGLDDI